MRKEIALGCLALAFAMPAAAQETYENTNLVDKDLNGTARYVGMGGAMEALGADISTISSNPAGLGLYRKSYVSASAGLVSQSGVDNFDTGSKTNASFDQVGFVYAMRTGQKGFLNFGFNYHKSRNFNQILSAANEHVSGASQNKLTYIKLRDGLLYNMTQGLYPNENGGALASHSQLDNIYYNSLIKYNDGTNTSYGYYNADNYTYDRANTGYIAEYDFNISGNINDRVYLGMTIGLHDVHYRGYSEYTDFLSANQDGIDYLKVSDSREITGTGFDIKAGAIFRPVEESPFRIGLYVQSPTWYDLKTTNYTTVTDGNAKPYSSESYDFKVYTPWTFGISLGHTVGNYLALGATYEYADYSTMDTRVIDGSYYDDWGYSYDETSSDDVMNRHTKETLKGVSTLKLGVEVKPTPELALRIGYNYVSPMYQTNGYKDGTLQSYGSYYASATDYVNWKSTNRLSLGIGYQVGKLNLDLAYVYGQTNGEFHPFMDSYFDNTSMSNVPDDAKESIDNYADAVKVSNKQHKLLFTIGYRF